MIREKIILSDLDLRIISFIQEERLIKEVINKLDLNYSQMKKHLDRLKKINCITLSSFGTFKKVKINKRGEILIKFFISMLNEQ